MRYCEYQDTKSQSQSGFTLIEMCVVLMIVGVMVVGALKAYKVYEQRQKIDQVNAHMASVNDALNAFPTMIDPATGDPYGRLPCPAPMDGSAAGNGFNEEACSGAGVTGVVGTDGRPVLIGKLPTATLGVSGALMRDPFNNFVTYAVSLAATDASTYGNTLGAIEVIEEGEDLNPSSGTYGQIVEIARHTTAQYVVVSAGRSDIGAYAFNGDVIGDCSDANPKEQENCDGDHVFTISTLSEQLGNNFYDDKAIFAVNTVAIPTTEEPPMCEQMDSFTTYGDKCPEGWEEQAGIDVVGVGISVGPGFYHGGGGGGGRNLIDNITYGYSMTVGGVSHMTVYDTKNGSKAFYNVNPDTGDYYMTTFETPNTVMGPDFTKPPIYCTKKSDNNTKTHCFTQKLNVAASSPGSIHDSCPEGYNVVDYKGSIGVPAEHGMGQVGGFTQAVCGK